MKIMERIKLLPQYVQDIIWSFNVEGHHSSMKTILNELNENQSAYCMRCLKQVSIKGLVDIDQMNSFSAEYFFKTKEICYDYGLICCSDTCKGHVTVTRFENIWHHRKYYYRERDYRLNRLNFDDVHDDDEDDDDDE